MFSALNPFRARFDAPAPEVALCVVGDIHGRLDCLERLLGQIAPDLRLVFVGDYIDRGDHSAQVLARLTELAQARPESVFLRGNHEEMLLDFLDDPEGTGPRWLRHGGQQTLASFGLAPLHSPLAPQSLHALRDALRARLGAPCETWLRHLPRAFQSGNIAVVHAGADPRLPLAQQSDESLTWGHPAFAKRARRDGIWVVHGHSIVPKARATGGVISVDTGAYMTDRLSGAVIRARTLQFLVS